MVVQLEMSKTLITILNCDKSKYCYIFQYRSTCTFPQAARGAGAGFMNRRRLRRRTAAILTSDLTTHNYVGFMKRHSNYLVMIQSRVGPIRWTRAWR